MKLQKAFILLIVAAVSGCAHDVGAESPRQSPSDWNRYDIRVGTESFRFALPPGAMFRDKPPETIDLSDRDYLSTEPFDQLYSPSWEIGTGLMKPNDALLSVNIRIERAYPTDSNDDLAQLIFESTKKNELTWAVDEDKKAPQYAPHHATFPISSEPVFINGRSWVLLTYGDSKSYATVIDKDFILAINISLTTFKPNAPSIKNAKIDMDEIIQSMTLDKAD